MGENRGRLLWTVIVLMLGWSLAGCSGPRTNGGAAANPKSPTTLAFQLGSLELSDETQSDATAASPVRGLSSTPQQSLVDWATARFEATEGQPGTVRIRLMTARAVGTALERTAGVRGWFTRDQAERVTMTFGARIDALRNDGQLIASAEAFTEAYRTFPEGITAEDRRSRLDRLMKEALQAFDRQMESRTRAEMPDLLR